MGEGKAIFDLTFSAFLPGFKAGIWTPTQSLLDVE
jgi:hypothetical protein